MFRGLFHYVDRQSFIHRTDPRVKLLLLIPIFLVAMTSGETYTLLFVLLTVVFLYAIAHIPFHRYKGLMMVSLLTSISFFFFGGFFYFGFYNYPGKQVTVLLWIFRPENAGSSPILGPIILALTEGRGIVVCAEGFMWAVITTLKFLTFVLASNLMIMTTKPKEILLALNKIGIPLKLTFVAMTALRFIPILMEEWYVTQNAQQARGLKFRKLDPKSTISALRATLETLVVNSIRRARILALAMETRAFGADSKKVSFKELKMTRLDKTLAIVIIVITVTILILIIYHTYWGGTI